MKILKFRWKLLLIPSLIFLLLLTIYKLPNTFGTLLAGIIIYVILNPIVDFLNKRIKMRVIWAFAVFMLFFVFLFLCGSVINYIATAELPKLANHMPSFISAVNSIAKDFDNRLIFLNRFSGGALNNFAYNIINSIFSSGTINALILNAKQALFTFMAISFDFVMAVIIALYLVIDESRIIRFIESTFPKKVINTNRDMWKDMMRCMSGYFIGLVILGLILFLLSWIGLIFLKVQYAFLLSLWIGATIIIPYIGPFIGSMPAVAVAFSQNMMIGIWTTVYFIVIQFLVTSVLGPKILGEIIGIHPIIVILTLIAGGELGGIVGMIIAVPLTSLLLIFLKYYWTMFAQD